MLLRGALGVLVVVLLAGCGGGRPRSDGSLAPRLSDAQAADSVQRVDREPRPGNIPANHTTPSAAQLAAFHAAQRGSPCPATRYVTGAYTGTTDEIIQWAAAKWGFDPNLFRAVTVAESNWDMHVVSDAGQSFGITQVKRTIHRGTWPLSARSTAFNLDYYGSVLRCYVAGHMRWLNGVEHVGRYGPGDLWGSVGAWFSGRWYVNTDEYLGQVRSAYMNRPWGSPGF